MQSSAARDTPRVPPRSRRRVLVPLAGALAAAGVLSACSSRIEENQWRDIGIHTEQWRSLPSVTSNADSDRTRTSTGGSNNGSGSNGGGSGGDVAPTSGTDFALGVVVGATDGGTRADRARVVVETGGGTCWWLTVDGIRSTGCGNGEVSDTRGERAGRVIKQSGGDPITLKLIAASGQEIDVGVVSGVGHYVTVTNQVGN